VYISKRAYSGGSVLIQTDDLGDYENCLLTINGKEYNLKELVLMIPMVGDREKIINTYVYELDSLIITVVGLSTVFLKLNLGSAGTMDNYPYTFRVID
jgi:hypothetical protein